MGTTVEAADRCRLERIGHVSVCSVATSRLRPMAKWEYVTVPVLVHATKQILDNWGEDGWELVQIVPGPNPENVVAYFKREKSA